MSAYKGAGPSGGMFPSLTPVPPRRPYSASLPDPRVTGKARPATVDEIDAAERNYKGKRKIDFQAWRMAAMQRELVENPPITTNVSRSRAMGSALAAARRVRVGGSY